MEDKEIYQRWHKRKNKKGKNEKEKEREYAVKQAKIERVERLIEEGVAAKLQASEAPTLEEAKKLVSEAMGAALREDMTGTLKRFEQKKLDAIAKAAVKAAKSVK